MDAALRHAIDEDDLGAVRALVHQNVHSATRKDADSGRCALHHAAATGKTEALGVLLEYVLSHVGTDAHHDTPLSLALRGGHGACVDLLLRYRKHLWHDEHNAIDALIAGRIDDGARAGQLYRLGLRLRRSAGPVIELRRARTAGMEAIAAAIGQREDDRVEAAQCIVTHRVDALRALLGSGRVHPNEIDAAGRPLLGLALEHADMDAVDALMDAGAQPDGCLDGGITLTERAIASTDRPLIRHWLARTRDELDRTGLPDAARRILRDDIDEPDRLQSTWGRGQRHPSDLSRAMAAAAWRGKRRCAQWLEARGAHMPWLGPALFCADIAWLERLHRDGARVEPPLGDGLGCLHLLALLPSEVDVEPLARRLLEWGAELDAAPRRWGSAVSFAKRLGRSDVVDALRRSSSRAAFRWQAEARASGIERVVFFYDKADGLVFTPQRAELPFEVGGDYDGGYPSSAVRALEQVRGTRLWKRLTASQQRVIESLAVGEDLSLESILAVVPERSVRRRD